MCLLIGFQTIRRDATTATTSIHLNGALHDKAARAGCGTPGLLREHLADQLLLPMALATKGAFTTAVLSSHTRTNIGVIEKFLPLEFAVALEDGVHRVSLTRE